jgi:polar amino acid transport system substrate-binding protein
LSRKAASRNTGIAAPVAGSEAEERVGWADVGAATGMRAGGQAIFGEVGRRQGRFAPALAVLLALATLIPGSSARAADCLLRVGWSPYAIYTYAEPDGSVHGIDATILNAAAAEADCRTEWRSMPWARTLLEIQNGTIDAGCSASFTAERDSYALFSVPYRISEVAIFVRRGESAQFPLRSLADIVERRLRLGVIVGYFYGSEFARLSKEPVFAAQVDPGADYPVNIQKLVNGRIDGVLVDDVNVMVGEAKTLGLDGQIEQHPLRITTERLHFMFSRKSVAPATVARIDAAIQRMRNDGRLQAAFDQYLK